MGILHLIPYCYVFLPYLDAIRYIKNNQKSFPLEVFIIESHPLSLVQVWKSLVYLYWIRNQNIQYHQKVFSFLSLGTYKLTPIISDVFFRLVILVPLITPYTLSSHNEIKINLPNLNDMSEMMSISLSCFFNPLNQIKLKTIVVLDQICEVCTSFMATRSTYKAFWYSCVW